MLPAFYLRPVDQERRTELDIKTEKFQVGRATVVLIDIQNKFTFKKLICKKLKFWNNSFFISFEKFKTRSLYKLASSHMALYLWFFFLKFEI